MSARHHQLRAAIVTTALFLLAACGHSTMTPDTAPPMDSLVSTEWLAQHLGEDDLVVLDATVTVEQAEDGSFRTGSTSRPATFPARATYRSGT